MPYTARPTLPWASDATYSVAGDAYDGTNTKVTPTAGQIAQGARPKRQLAARYFNWALNKINSIFEWFAQRLADGVPHAFVMGTKAAMLVKDEPVDGEIFFATDLGMPYRWNPALDPAAGYNPFTFDRTISGVTQNGLWECMGPLRWRLESNVAHANVYFNSATYADVAGSVITIPWVEAGDTIRVHLSIGMLNPSTLTPAQMAVFGKLRAIYNDGSDHVVNGIDDVEWGYHVDDTGAVRGHGIAAIGSYTVPSNATQPTVKLQMGVVTATSPASGWDPFRVHLEIEVIRHGSS